MTDETAGPELPVATGGWTNGRTRLCRPGRMRVGEGSRPWLGAAPALLGAGIVQVLLSPGKRKDKEVRPGGHLIVLLLRDGCQPTGRKTEEEGEVRVRALRLQNNRREEGARGDTAAFSTGWGQRKAVGGGQGRQELGLCAGCGPDELGPNPRGPGGPCLPLLQSELGFGLGSHVHAMWWDQW